MDDGFHDKNVFALAAEVAEAKDRQIPRILMQLKGILANYSQGSPQLVAVKQDIWSYDLLNVMLAALKQDFAKIHEGWKVASELSSLLSQCCVGLDPTQRGVFYDKFLPQSVDQILIISRKLQNRFAKTAEYLEDTKRDLLKYFKETVDAVVMLFSGHYFLANYVLRSPWMMQMLMSDDARTTIIVMGAISSANRMKSGIFGELTEDQSQEILDELVYKLSSTAMAEVAAQTAKTILVICDSHPPVLNTLCDRYKGLKPLLTRWQGQGFGRELTRLQMSLEAGDMQKAEMAKLHRAAMVIQAMWKSFATRKKLKRADRAMSSFQRSFRAKREYNERLKQEQKQQRELKHFLLLQRKKKMREMRKRQLEAMQFLPAEYVAKFLAQEEEEAALKVQKLWRGHQVRQTIHLQREGAERLQATVKIQRCVRKWLERLQSRRKEPPAFQRPPGLTDERRVDLQARIVEWRERHMFEPGSRGRTQQEELHQKAQTMLSRHCRMSKLTRKNEMHRHALLARLDMDASLLMNAPKLSEVQDKDLEMYVCRNVPISTKARHDHNEEMRLLKQPWWRKLGDEYQDQKYEEEQEDWRVF